MYGVIFLFRYPTGELQQRLQEQQRAAGGGPLDGHYDYSAAERLFFAAQTIQNACGTQALLSVLLNKDGGGEDGSIDVGPQLREFKDFTTAFPADVCANPYSLYLAGVRLTA